MRLAAIAALAASLVLAAPGATQGRGHHERDQDAAYRARVQGGILPLDVILTRVRVQVRGAQYIGADLDPSGSVYRLTFMDNGGNVLRLHVDARTGRPLGFSR